MEHYWTKRWLVFITCLHVAVTTRTSYKVAVYEHVIISPDDAEADFTREEAFFWMSKNLKVFEQQTSIAAQKGVDIIVFPEYGVTGFDHSRDSLVPFLEDIPDPSVNWVPCDDSERFPDTKVLHSLSCMAKKFSIYVVANVGDIKKCDMTDSSCPKDKRYQFNTNIVFDSKGKLTARYHKLNLYDEMDIFDPAPTPEYVTFDTPFGLFGTVVCFDLMHYYPTQVLLSDPKVKNLLVTSAWNVFYPFVMSSQMYSGISKLNGVNVIASNARSSSYIMASSGIFGARVSVLSDPDFMNDEGVLLVADLDRNAYEGIDTGVKSLDPIYMDISQVHNTNFTYQGSYQFKGMVMSFVVLHKNSTSAEVCRGTICCAVKYQVETNAPDELFIASALDLSMEEPGKVHLQLCAVHKCQTQNIASCGQPVYAAKTKFKYLKLQGFFNEDLVFPIVSTSPFNNITFLTEKDNYYFDKEHAIIETRSLKHPLHALTLLNSITEVTYGSYDGPRTGKSSKAPIINMSHLLQSVCITTILLVNFGFRNSL